MLLLAGFGVHHIWTDFMKQSCCESNQARTEMLQPFPTSLTADHFPKFPPQTALFSCCEQKLISYKSTHLTCIISMALLQIFSCLIFLSSIYSGISWIVRAFIQKQTTHYLHLKINSDDNDFKPDLLSTKETTLHSLRPSKSSQCKISSA